MAKNSKELFSNDVCDSLDVLKEDPFDSFSKQIFIKPESISI